ncbi:hypothetical protein PR202_gb03566 [Eleusine coracana subsp. coracana]|uniref:Secreted protein n=1 Tax=Eleusine coracana subsp. coracana TaxID=191504 RepID=A0AAV5E173_ELECO|nr:hypothetical protein PR202_gb03549 [Eleusine coracana subsp. coracana]GJN16564.1 hypothetical protein PR202_gb03566 [Eleusine coracana subsp. coracana]
MWVFLVNHLLALACSSDREPSRCRIPVVVDGGSKRPVERRTWRQQRRPTRTAGGWWRGGRPLVERRSAAAADGEEVGDGCRGGWRRRLG